MQEAEKVSSSEPSIMFFPVPRTSGLGKTYHVSFAKHQQPYILTRCKISLTQGHYTWMHNEVLWHLALVLKERKSNNSAFSPSSLSNTMAFVPTGKVLQGLTVGKESSQLETVRNWKMKVELDQMLTFPPEIITNTLRHDPILCSASQKFLLMREDADGEVYKCRKLNDPYL